LGQLFSLIDTSNEVMFFMNRLAKILLDCIVD
jgi:hypothetical protein